MRRRKPFTNLDNVKLSTSFKNFLRWQKEKRAKKKDLSYRVGQSPEKIMEFLKYNRTKSQLKGEPLFLVPDGLGPTFKKRGFSKFEEFQWWNEKLIGNVLFTFVPAQHWSKRTPWDTNLSLWGGWVIRCLPEDYSKTVYFAGDSGYFRGFREIGNRFKNIDIALLPIGCYEPEWFMCTQHVTPEQAVSAFRDTGAECFVPMHYEAFRLGDDTPQEAIERLELEWKRQCLDSSRLKILKLGETLDI